MNGRPPSLRDVAERARVSHQTVSRVINNFPGVRPETRERVHQAIDELGYRRNNAARTLVTQRSGLIGIIAVGSFLYGPTSTLAAIEEAARKHGFMTLLATLRDVAPGGLTEAVNDALNHDVEALVVIASREALLRRTAELQLNVPLIVVGPSPDDVDDLMTLSVDQAAGAASAIDHLAGLGHRRVVLLAGPQDWVDAQQRLSAAERACERHNIATQVVFGDWTAASGFAAGQELLASWASDLSGSLPTAVFAANDQMALGLLAAFNEAGVSVPSDISVVGFDDIAGADHFSPSLTTVHQDFTALGFKVMQATLAALGGEKPDLAPVSAQLRVRASTAAPRV
ncbi:LacI family DNA-binding transcriptional regulator [Propionimicrobium sp. PCR01-08-3]|uniref:LacI family DNA-binding transcriptional regulator n=1 Tax=Propionimicrobium sp. PCR01-08-3 TaxID=3052086 RepID=UPI00255C729F|nr:LacI family DNA-binding transcriptional regulator [Propionimicrobium sp. PCR01-08-3]WIY82386.1 LacI family DNA-binding transcriptional regulator [Propionimicrobium sp. PCR01-08-3]